LGRLCRDHEAQQVRGVSSSGGPPAGSSEGVLQRLLRSDGAYLTRAARRGPPSGRGERRRQHLEFTGE